MIKVIGEWKLDKSKPNYEPRPRLYDILRDIVGFRLICIDDSARAVMWRRIARSDSLRIRSGSEAYRSRGSRSRDAHHELVESVGRQIPLKQKDSGYESDHFELSFDGVPDKYEQSRYTHGRVFAARVAQINDLREKISDVAAHHIRTFPIELQLRTFTEHIWAYEEHGKRYAPGKAGFQMSRPSDERRLNTSFIKLADALKKVERVKGTIDELYAKQVTRTLRFAGKSYEIGGRGFYFNDPTFDRYFQRIDKINNEVWIVASRTSGPPQKTLEILRNIIDVCADVESGTNECLLDTGYAELTEPYWGRQRVILLMIGFLLLFADEADRLELLSCLTEEKALIDIIGTSGFDEGGRVATGRLYEYVKGRDKLMLKRENLQQRHLFEDPLVYSRVASCAYREQDFHGAAQHLSELFDSGWWKYFWEGNHPALTVPERCQFYVRRAEYYWYHSMRSGEEHRFSEHSFNDLTECFNEGRPDLKVLSWAIIVASIMESRKYVDGRLLTLFSANEQSFNNLIAEKREAKPYVNVAQALYMYKYNLDGENLWKLKLAEARKLLRNGIAHPREAIRIWLSMCDSIEASIEGGLIAKNSISHPLSSPNGKRN
jgi:hypothetical protein